MRFYGIRDFYENKELHQIKYMLMNKKQKKAYKRFVYSISFEKEKVKDMIWEYLNNDDESKERLTNEYNKRFGKMVNNEVS